MNDLPQGTLEGFALADEGARRAMQHANAVTGDTWADQARGFMAGFISQHPSFSSEDVWLAAEKAGIPKPPDRRAWGGVINGFTKDSKKRKTVARIRKVGEGYSKLEYLHGNHIAVYERI